jgi:hypothetical protein
MAGFQLRSKKKAENSPDYIINLDKNDVPDNLKEILFVEHRD